MKTQIKYRRKTTITALLVLALALAWFTLLPLAQAVSPTPDGSYAGANTAEGGSGTLFSLTSGTNNTALGSEALFTVTTGSQNTATGCQALKNNTANANTADGFQALVRNNSGTGNTATGWRTLFQNTSGGFNTATGWEALYSNNGSDNTATGTGALADNTTGFSNTATGSSALLSNTGGSFNTAVGYEALLINTTGNRNTAIGASAGTGITGSGNVYIGFQVSGTPGESNITRIRNIGNTAQNTGIYVTLDSVGGTQLGYVNLSSSRRHKQDITPMENASEALFALIPVKFHYKPDFDPDRAERFGLIGEDVEKINPDLVAHNDRGEVTTVRYECINAMLLNEFLKEHRKVEEQGKRIEQLTAQLREQAAQIQKVSGQLAAIAAAPKIVKSN